MTTYKIFGYERRPPAPPKAAWSGIEAEYPNDALRKIHETKRRARRLNYFEVIAESNVSEYESGVRREEGTRKWEFVSFD